jgi:hypothetical protein
VVLVWLRGEGWGRAVRLLAPLAAMLVEGWPAGLGALLVQEGGLWFAARLTDTCERGFARRLFLAAYGLRVAVALPTHYLAKLGDGNGALFRDDYTNDLVGEWLIRIIRGDGTVSIFPGHQHLLDGMYPYLLMGLYAVFGYTPLLPKLINIGLAALSAVLIFDITRRTFGGLAAVLAALGATLLPTVVIWSVVSLKESLVLFTVLLGLRIVQFLTTAPRHHPRFADALVVLLGLLTLMLDLRAATTFILLVLVGIVYVARSSYRPRPWQVGLVALAAVVLAASGLWVVRGRNSNRPVTSLVEDVALQLRHRRAQEASSARSQLRPERDVFTVTGGELPAAEEASDSAPFTVVGDLLDPLGYALLAPAPWQARTLPEFGASAEMPVWYVLLAASTLAWRASRGQRLFVICLVVYGVANWLVLAATEGNLGNLLRHRLMLDPVLLMLGGAGLAWLRVRTA